MAAPAAVLSILVKANTGQATTGLLRVNQQLDLTEQKSHKVARAMEGVAKGVALVGGAAVVGGLAYATKKAAEFEQQMSSLGAVADANAKQMKRFRDQALKAGADTKFSALEAAQAQTELAKGGLKVRQIMRGGLKSALALAAAGEMELADAAEATVNAMKLFGLRGKDAMKVADGFATAANKTTADVSDFALALKMGGSAAKAAGLNFIETTSALEALAEIGIRGSDAGTSLKAMLTQLAAPTAKQRELTKKLNLSFFDSHGNMKSLVSISKMLGDRLEDMTKKQQLQTVKTLAGTDGMRALLAIYDAGPKKMERFQKDLGKQGTAADVAKKKQDNLKGSLEQLGGSIETLGIQVGTALIPVIRTAADELTDLANDIGKIIQRDDLTLGEKLQKSIDLAQVRVEPWVDKLKKAIDQANIPDKIATAISAATPVIIKAAAAGGLVAAKTFASAFAQSDVWGKLVLGGWLLSRMGGKAGFFKMGAAAGGSFGAGMASTAGMGLGGKLRGLMGGLGSLAKKVIGLDVLINLVDSNGNPIAAAVNTAHDLTFGIVPKINIKTGDERWREGFEKITGQLDRALKDRNVGGIIKITNRIKAMADEARAFHREDLAGELDKLATKGSKSVDHLVASAKQIDGMAGRFKSAIRGLKLQGGKDFDGLVRQVTFGSKQILKVGGEKSQATREVIGKQFDLARKRIRDHFRGPDGVVHMSKAGYEALHQLAVKELGLYGIKAGRVNVVLAKGANGQMRPNARGGFQTGGKPVGDSIPSMLERGEYVVNRRAVSKVGKRALDRLNFGMAPRFQQGGMVDPAWDPGSERLNSSISGRVGQWAKRFQANMTAGYDPGGGHVSPGHNVTGTATDMVPLAGNWDLLEKGLRLLVAAGTKVLYGTNGVGTPWPNHGRGNHAHIEWGTGGGFSMFNGLKRVALSGPSSAAMETGQGGLDRVRGAANAAINRAVMFSTEGPEGGSNAPAMSGNGSGLMKAISASRGWSFPDWWALDAAETGHGANLANPTSSARLRGQFLSMNYGKYGPGSDPGQNPSMAEQIYSMAQYIGERYNNPTAAWTFHRAHNYYKAGGLVGSVGKTLSRFRGAKSPKLRRGAVDKLLDRVKRVGLGPGLQKNLKSFSRDANTFGEYADRAGAVSGDTGPVKVKGKTQAEWLEAELEALFKWRNALIRAEEVVRKRREQIAKAVDRARKRMHAISDRLRVLNKHPKQNKTAIRALTREQGALSGRILPALTGKRSGLNTLRGDLLSNLQDVQGLGAPSGVLKRLPALGVLGGRIFDTQMQLRDLRAPTSSVTDSDAGSDSSESSGLLADLLREANLRTAVSEKQFDVFKNMPQFATGGIVPGAQGAAVPAVVHAGEGVFTRDQMAAMGGTGTVVNVTVAPGMEWLKQFINVQVQEGTRKQARSAGRNLPGRGGGGLRG